MYTLCQSWRCPIPMSGGGGTVHMATSQPTRPRNRALWWRCVSGPVQPRRGLTGSSIWWRTRWRASIAARARPAEHAWPHAGTTRRHPSHMGDFWSRPRSLAVGGPTGRTREARCGAGRRPFADHQSGAREAARCVRECAARDAHSRGAWSTRPRSLLTVVSGPLEDGVTCFVGYTTPLRRDIPCLLTLRGRDACSCKNPAACAVVGACPGGLPCKVQRIGS